MDGETSAELVKLQNTLWSFLTHYKVVLEEHQLPVPFNEAPRS